MGAPGPVNPWSPFLRLSFRFVFAYEVLYNFPFPFAQLPGRAQLNLRPQWWLAFRYQAFWEGILPWLGHHLFGMTRDAPSHLNGSGDRTFDYLQLFCLLSLALAATVAWTALEAARRGQREEYVRLHSWLRVYLRYALGVAMLCYGVSKLFALQFPAPSAARLMETFGHATPRRLLWNFMGASPLYTAFTGGCETLGGCLLFFRRTTTLGGLVLVAVLTNVVLLNLCYDVPVKLNSMNLLAMALVLVAPEGRRLASILLFDRATAPAGWPPLFDSLRLRRVALFGGFAFGTFALWSVCSDNFQAWKAQRAAPTEEAPFGTWAVASFVSTADSGVSPAPWLWATTRWGNEWVLTRPGPTPQDVDVQRIDLEVDADAGRMLLSPADGGPLSILAYGLPDSEHLDLSGRFDGVPVVVKLRRVDPTRAPLLRSPFRWVTDRRGAEEGPY